MPMSGAERQRRYMDRLRQSDADVEFYKKYFNVAMYVALVIGVPCGVLFNNHVSVKHDAHIQIAKPAPEISATAIIDGEFKNISLHYFKSKYVVLILYPVNFTFQYQTQISEFSERNDDFRKLRCEVIYATKLSPEPHLAWIEARRKNSAAAWSYNMRLLCGIRNEESSFPSRAMFIIDYKQYLRQVTVNDTRSVQESLRQVIAFQFSDNSGRRPPGARSTTSKPDTKAAHIEL